MNKLNELGMNAIEFRKEFLNPAYPELVHDSIGYAIDKNFEDCPVVIEKMKTLSLSEQEFVNFLLTQDVCKKTYEELLVEFETIRKKLSLDCDYVETISDVTNDNILVKMEMLLTEDFLREYFYIESDAEFEKLMSRKGFIEKFAILRLKKIIADFLYTLNREDVLAMTISNTPVFFNSEKNVYGIYIEMKLNVNDLDTDSQIDEIKTRASHILNLAYTMFKEKMKV